MNINAFCPLNADLQYIVFSIQTTISSCTKKKSNRCVLEKAVIKFQYNFRYRKLKKALSLLHTLQKEGNRNHTLTGANLLDALLLGLFEQFELEFEHGEARPGERRYSVGTLTGDGRLGDEAVQIA